MNRNWYVKNSKTTKQIMTIHIKSIVKSLIKSVLYLLPIQKKKVLFVNYDFKGYGDNPKYIAEEIIRQGLPWKMVWLVAKKEAFVPSYIKKVYRGVEWFYELSTASIIITNRKGHLIPDLYKKKEKQFFLQTWHGDFPLKYIEKEVEDTLWTGYVSASKADSAITNAIISGNKQFTKILKDSFWLPEDCEILEFGSPRNDIYFKGETVRDELRCQNGFSSDDRILLYAPTFRDGGDVSSYNIDFERLRTVLCKRDNEKWKIIIRLHPNISSKANVFSYDDSIINGSLYPDQQELCLMSDCVITDYSSIMADFMLMRKPVFLYVPDLEKYSDQNTGRGLRELFYKLPFAYNKTQDELEFSIMSFDKEKYAEKLNAFMQEEYCTFDDGHASERVVNYLKKALV